MLFGKHQKPDPGTVMIEDEFGKERPWTIIPRPETIEKNYSLKQLMGLGSDPESVGEDETANEAANDIYRSICTSTRHAMNAIIPGAKHGKLKWKHITSAEKAAVYEEVLESNPYLQRFPGGWITEVVMQRQLRNSRDTAARTQKLKARKPHISKARDKSQAPRKGQLAPGALVPASKAANPRQGPTEGMPSNGPGRPGNNRSNRADHSNHSEFSEEDTNANHNVPKPPLRPGQPPNTSNKATTLLGYFQPVRAHTKHQKRPENNTSHNGQVACEAPPENNSEEEDWDINVSHQIAKLMSNKRSKELEGNNSAAGPSSAAKGNRMPPVPLTPPPAENARTKVRPKQRPPPATEEEEDAEEPELFHRTTRAAKQRMIKAIGTKEPPSPPKAAPKGKKRARTGK
ncbi:hypothetical protein CTheo_1731 [Ceratobasidium theobromae]|uniref:Uncharacterized protein n=1 Tax=Ceratobasidium theobromae TaxID=1582974 RepID=A0A5N5QSL4_9AGAM|nr:hypothetical protein CTheo_1731 [Ceratobasidium theobromae]